MIVPHQDRAAGRLETASLCHHMRCSRTTIPGGKKLDKRAVIMGASKHAYSCERETRMVRVEAFDPRQGTLTMRVHTSQV